MASTPTVADKYSAQRIEDKSLYSDFMTDFNFHPQTKKMLTIKDEVAVTRSIRNLLLTDRYERLFRPQIGSTIRSMLFEDISGHTTARLKTAIEETIENHEPRANLLEVVVTPYPEQNGYVVTVVFFLRNESEAITINMPLVRVR